MYKHSDTAYLRNLDGSLHVHVYLASGQHDEDILQITVLTFLESVVLSQTLYMLMQNYIL